jgi:hypothetical protein
VETEWDMECGCEVVSKGVCKPKPPKFPASLVAVRMAL